MFTFITRIVRGAKQLSPRTLRASARRSLSTAKGKFVAWLLTDPEAFGEFTSAAKSAADGAVEDAVSELDFEDKIQKAAEEFDFGDVLSEWAGGRSGQRAIESFVNENVLPNIDVDDVVGALDEDDLAGKLINVIEVALEGDEDTRRKLVAALLRQVADNVEDKRLRE